MPRWMQSIMLIGPVGRIDWYAQGAPLHPTLEMP